MADKELNEVDSLKKEISDLEIKINQLEEINTASVRTFVAVRDSQMDTINELKQELKITQDKLIYMGKHAELYVNFQESDLSSKEKVLVLAKRMSNLCDSSIKCEGVGDIFNAAQKVYEKTVVKESYRDMEVMQLRRELDKSQSQLFEYKKVLCDHTCSPKELQNFIAAKEKQLKEMLSASPDLSKISQCSSVVDVTAKTFGNKRNILLDLCRKRLAGYGLNIYDFSKSWSDGVAFCTLIHSFRPELVDIEVVKGNSVQENFLLARDLSIELGIPKENFDFNYLFHKNGTLDFVKVIDLVEKIFYLLNE